MRISNGVILTAFLFSFCGCSDPKIDASSDESMSQSVKAVRQSLPESKRADFDNALLILAFSLVDRNELSSEHVVGVGKLEGNARHLLNGKTGEQILAEAERVLAERREREVRQALEEIEELESKLAKSENARQHLKSFQILRSRFYTRNLEYVGRQQIIELTVKNGTEYAVSCAYFEGTLASPDRSVPWHKDNFSYNIPGGLEPGEEATWKLAPNMFSDWAKVNAPKDAVFTVTVEQLDGPDGEPVYSTREFSDYDQKRLDMLKKEFGVQR